MFSRIVKARKQYTCEYGRDVINPGETYTDDVYPPWTRIQDDPESTSPLGMWMHVRYHSLCYAELIYG